MVLGHLDPTVDARLEAALHRLGRAAAGDLQCDVRRVAGPAVREGRVPVRQLERGHRHVALADRHVHVVAGEPVPGEEQLGVGVVLRLALARRGDAPVLLGRQRHTRLLVEPEQPDGLLHRLVAEAATGPPEVGTDAVEVRVGRHGHGPAHVHGPVGLRACVAERALPAALVQRERAGVDEGLVRGAQPVHHRRHAGEQLERGTGRVLALDGAVEDGLVGRVAGEELVVLRRDAVDEVAGVVDRVAGHGEHRAVAGIGDHDGPGVAPVGQVAARDAAVPGRFERLGEEVLGQCLGLDVDGEPDVVAGDRRGREVAQDADRVAHGVHLEDGLAGHAAQVVLVDPLDAGLADLVPPDVRLGLVHPVLELDVVDLADVADDVGSTGAEGVAAHRDPLDGHGGEQLLVLLDVDLQLLGGILGHGHRRVPGVPLVVDPVEQLLDRGRRAVPGELVGQAAQHVHGLGVVELGEPDPVDGDDDGDPVVDQHRAVAVEDAPARGLDLHDPDAVRLGGLRERLRRQHLQVPEPGEERHEERDDHDAEHAEAQAGRLHAPAHRRPRIDGWSMRSGAAFSIQRATKSAGKARSMFMTEVTSTIRGRFGRRNCCPSELAQHHEEDDAERRGDAGSRARGSRVPSAGRRRAPCRPRTRRTGR